ncbi:MAG: hypothetical protein KDN05_22705 [Verrucomicrobiae bacterium]|nr:hypothetical protein [Verrucomicrobiae bacterium]
MNLVDSPQDDLGACGQGAPQVKTFVLWIASTMLNENTRAPRTQNITLFHKGIVDLNVFRNHGVLGNITSRPWQMGATDGQKEEQGDAQVNENIHR